MAEDWTYEKDGGLEFDVRQGDVWVAGAHTLVCGDLEAGAGLRLMEILGPGNVALAYCDLPYNAGLARGYRTKAGVDGEAGRAVDFDAFLGDVFGALTYGRVPMWFIETGNQTRKRVRERAQEAGAVLAGDWQITYYRKHPCSLQAFVFAQRSQDEHDLVETVQSTLSPEGMDDDHTPEWAMGNFTRPGDTVVDLCMGRGLTAATAERMERAAAGTELSPHRLSVTLRKLRDLGCIPMRMVREEAS